MKKMRIAIIGATGFIGSNLAKHISSQNSFSNSLSLITRNQADHLDFHKIKKSIDGTDVIFHAAGLAWQHPAIATNKQELLIEQIMQNSISALVISLALVRRQKLIWISTNAVDSFLEMISDIERRNIEQLIDLLLAKINPQKMRPLEIRLIIFRALNNCSGELKNVVQDYSYAFSKYLGQRILERKSRGNIKIVKISDVYGPGQDISTRIINPLTPARRIQRFVAAYKLIKERSTEWIPIDKPLHGFYIRDEKIIHEVKTDFIYPTYIDDVCKSLIDISQLELSKTLFDATGERMSNYAVAETIRDFFRVEVEIRQNKNGLEILDYAENAISFKKGLEKWIIEGR